MPVRYRCKCGDCLRQPLPKSKFCKVCKNRSKWRGHNHR